MFLNMVPTHDKEYLDENKFFLTTPPPKKKKKKKNYKDMHEQKSKTNENVMNPVNISIYKISHEYICLQSDARWSSDMAYIE